MSQILLTAVAASSSCSVCGSPNQNIEELYYLDLDSGESELSKVIINSLAK
jgi:hypothetical protein